NFALDTGASKSVINTPVATQLGLQVVGSAGQVTGVTGSVSANLVRVPNWKAGTVSLTPSDIIELDLGGATGNVGLQGLLGSDVLSAYGAITVDYDHQVLILTPH
ncbi:MAG: retropepsin-like domain-containing protein, partial [Chloroflexi bacterium]|nr:retropepsin-like domain-containing protein [Chloroflexota bacterium]